MQNHNYEFNNREIEEIIKEEDEKQKEFLIEKLRKEK